MRPDRAIPGPVAVGLPRHDRRRRPLPDPLARRRTSRRNVSIRPNRERTDCPSRAIRIMALALIVVSLPGCALADQPGSGRRPAPRDSSAWRSSLALFFRAMMANRFFSAVIRIQKDRGHHVIDQGPYAIVRHPGYAGMLPSMAFGGLALGSWMGFAIGARLFAADAAPRVLRRRVPEGAPRGIPGVRDARALPVDSGRLVGIARADEAAALDRPAAGEHDPARPRGRSDALRSGCARRASRPCRRRAPAPRPAARWGRRRARAVTRWTLAPATFTPCSSACRWASTPGNAGSSEGCTLRMAFGNASRSGAPTSRMKPARQTSET